MPSVKTDKESNETTSGNVTAKSFCSMDNLPSPTQGCGINDSAEKQIDGISDSQPEEETTSEVI